MDIDKLVSSLIQATVEKKIIWEESSYVPQNTADSTSYSLETPYKRVVISKSYTSHPVFDENVKAEYLLSIMPLDCVKNVDTHSCDQLSELFAILCDSMNPATDIGKIINWLTNL